MIVPCIGAVMATVPSGPSRVSADGARGSGGICGGGRIAGAALAVMEHGERIAGVYARSSLPRSRLGTRSGGAIGGGGLEEEPPMIGIGRGDELADVVVDKPGIEFVGGEGGMLQQALQEADVGRHTLDAEFAQARGRPWR